MRLFLIGFMGSGKSHVGRELAKRTGWQFVDLDQWIETQQRRRIADIFASDGEAAFRELERSALQEMIAFDPGVISCGGGTPCFFDNMDWMNQHGITVYLETPVPILVQRLQFQQAKRPLLQNRTAEELYVFIEQKLAERTVFYEQAQVVYHLSHGEEDVAGALLQQLAIK